RISSIEPNLLTEEIVSWIASGTKFLPHFHIPLQSGCNKTLKAMHRRYTREMFEQKIALIRSKMEHVFFGIDVIVGFPGETDEDFEQTYSFLEHIAPAYIHVFPYSRRADTEAATLPNQVQESIKTERVERLEALCSRLYSDFCAENSGRTEQVLFESKVKGGKMFGYTSNYIKVERPYDANQIGKIVELVLP
ncbi:MAG: radical SAM protein, partial [Bacteroidales bacterium]|nr:radical SAM protein [Bacteroidales bacterium]